MDSPRGSEVSGSGSIQIQRSQRLYRHLVTDAAAGLRFSQDMAAGIGSDSVSYSPAHFHQLFRPTGALKPSARRKTLCRPAPRPKGGPQEGFRGLQPSPDHSDSCSGTRPTAISSVGLYLKGASGWTEPVHKVAHRNHHHVLLDNSSEYHKNLQRWTNPASQRTTARGDSSSGRETSRSLKRDQTDLVDQVQPAAITSGPPTAASGPELAADGWTAAQCSALDGDHRRLIHTLLAQLFPRQDDQPDAQDRPPGSEDRPPGSEDRPPGRRLVVSLLTDLSSQTTLVRSLLAEQLNSSGWRSRQLSCDTLSRLRGPVNKDVVNKLIHLMCNDEHRSVRLNAAEALMKLGKLQEVHSELRLKLEEGQGLWGRMEALDVIGHLKLMTATLLEPLVSCFTDEFTAVRKLACQTAESLLLQEETVVSGLVELMENDQTQEVRLSAMTAVGALGSSSPAVQEALQRCVETEEEAELRLAACRLLQSSTVPSAQLQDFLLQRVDVETSWLVRRMMKEVLRLSGCSLQEERCHTKHMKYIRQQVERLCELSTVSEQVVLLEELQDESESHT